MEGVRLRTVIGIILTLYLLAAVAGLFAFDFGEGDPDPVEFDETVTVGLTLESELQLAADNEAVTLPRAQVFYSQYPYVVGYYGVERFVAERQNPGHDRQFGHPTAIYVSTYDEGHVSLTDAGYPVLNETVSAEEPEPTAETTDGHDHGHAAPPGTWETAESATYVVGSEARTPAGSTAIPFSDGANADDFIDAYGGEALSWDAFLDYPVEIDDAETVRNRTATQQTHADQLVTAVTEATNRPVETTVIESVQASIDDAPDDSAVLIPAGTYHEHVTVDRPITLVGEPGTELVGDGTGTVIELTADEAAVSNLAVSGVGNETPGAAATEGHDHGHDHDHGNGDEDEDWDDAIEDEYATGDAGILVDEAANAFIRDVTIETPASGVMLRNSPDSVVQNISVTGNPNYVEGHMGVVAMRSPGVIEGSTIRAGLDGVYTHDADGIVVRNNSMSANRMGVHLMHTSEALLADNEITNQTSAGIFVMTGPTANALTGNHISDTPRGIDLGGTDSYVADNLLIENDRGIQIDATGTVIERNRIVDNDIGTSTRALLATNRVTNNDFVGNDRHVGSSTGPERIWTHNETGNYWSGAVGTTDGTTLDRQYSPTDSIDAALTHVDGSPTLVESPARDALLGFEGAISGLRDGEIVDTAPLCAPVHTDWFEQDGRPLRPTC